jgi:hypothetical protein
MVCVANCDVWLLSSHPFRQFVGSLGFVDLRIVEGSVSTIRYLLRSANVDDAPVLCCEDGFVLCLVIWAFLLLLIEEKYQYQ